MLVSDDNIQAVKENSVPKNTARNTAWAVTMWKDWSAHHQQSYLGNYTELPVHLYIANNLVLDYWVSKFVVETKNASGDIYPPNTLYSACCGLQRYIKQCRPDVNILKVLIFLSL